MSAQALSTVHGPRSEVVGPSTWIPVALVAELLGVTRQAVHDRVRDEEWESRYAAPDSGGRRLEVALSALAPAVQVKALQRLAEAQRGRGAEAPEQAPAAGFAYDKASPTERAEADRRLGLLTQWRAFLAAQPGRNRAGDTVTFVRTARAQGARVSKSSLYAWDAAYTARGVDGLLPRYGGGREGSIQPQDRALFLQCWGCEQRPTLATAYRAYLVLRRREHDAAPHDARFAGPPPSEGAFRYLVTNLSEAEVILLRQGPKAVRAQLLPYTERDWEDCLPLEWWVMDDSPLDILALDDHGVLCRPYLSALMDMGTRRVCVTVCRAPNQYTTLWTLAKAILAWGTPQNYYVDNGKAFRSNLVTGGKKKKNRAATRGLNEGRVRSLCDKLGIAAHFAIKENAQAKPIERWFRTLEQNVAVLFETFVGNRPDRKPETLKDSIRDGRKAGDLPTFRDVERIVTGWIEGVYHKTPHTGRGMKGLTPDEAWAQRIGQVEVVHRTLDEIRYLLFNDHKPVKVARYQVRLFGRSYEPAPENPDCLDNLHGRYVVPLYRQHDIGRVFLELEDHTAVGWVVEKRLAAIGPVGMDVYDASRKLQRRARAINRARLAGLVSDLSEPDMLIRLAREKLAREDTAAPVGSLVPRTPPGAPKAAKIVALNPTLRAAAARAAVPPARPARDDAAAAAAALTDLIAEGAAVAQAAPAPQTDDWLDDLIQEGVR